VAIADESMPVMPDIPDVTPFVRGTKGAATIGVAIGIGATSNLTITFDRALPDTNYSIIASIEGTAGLLGNLVAVPISASKTTTSCVVAVKNTSLVTLGLNAIVTAFAVYT
jgi:hypothetical protein